MHSLLVQEVEAFLGDYCKLGISAEVTLSRFDDGRHGCSYVKRLGYIRHDGKFRLGVSDITIEPSGEEVTRSWIPWVNCTREIKLESIQHLVPLFTRIVQVATEVMQNAENASKKVRSFLKDFDNIQSEGK